MQIFEAGQPFTMNYAAYDQNPMLKVAFSVFDITTGTPVFDAQVIATELDFGCYSAEFVGDAGKTYLGIGAVYIDGDYSILAADRSPSSDTYQAKDVELTTLKFSYGTYDKNDSLFLRAYLYDVTDSAPELVDHVNLNLVALGVYCGSFLGVVNRNYQVAIVVYTDSNYAEVDPNRSPSVQGFNCILLSGVTLVLDNAVLEAQCLDAVLEGDCSC